jgi:hypothetical protein
MSTRAAWEEPSLDQRIEVSPEERHDMIAIAAYFLAERRGFMPGHEVQDWCEACLAIDRMLRSMGKAGVTRRDYERVGLRNALRLWVE